MDRNYSCSSAARGCITACRPGALVPRDTSIPPSWITNCVTCWSRSCGELAICWLMICSLRFRDRTRAKIAV